MTNSNRGYMLQYYKTVALSVTVGGVRWRSGKAADGTVKRNISKHKKNVSFDYPLQSKNTQCKNTEKSYRVAALNGINRIQNDEIADYD